MTIEITRGALSSALRAAVRERGADYVYPEEWKSRTKYKLCAYALPSGQPACLFGVAFDKLGVDITTLNQIESVRKVLRDLGVRDEALLQAASEAQSCQDLGNAWGVAEEVFERGLRYAAAE